MRMVANRRGEVLDKFCGHKTLVRICCFVDWNYILGAGGKLQRYYNDSCYGASVEK